MAAAKDVDRGLRCVAGLMLLAFCLFLFLSLFSYDWQDVSLLHVPPITPPCNLIGPVGAWLAFGLFALLGVGAYLVPFWCFVFGLILVFDREPRVWPRGVWLGVIVLCLTAFMELDHASWDLTCRRLNIVSTGGLFGRALLRGVFVRWLSPVGTGILVSALLLAAVVFLVEIRNLIWLGRLVAGGAVAGWTRLQALAEQRQDERQRIDKEQQRIEKERRRIEKQIEKTARKRKSPSTPAPPPEPAPAPAAEPEPPPAAPPPRPSRPPRKPAPSTAEGPTSSDDDGVTPAYERPPLSLLNEPSPEGKKGVQADTGTTGRILIDTLKEFGIETQVTNVEQGPVVTRYELLPAAGIRLERISGLSNNLALSLKATSVRVQAPIPGKGVVGIEVPNATSNVVYLREILEGDLWQSDKAALPLVLGHDVGGNDLVADLARMPHMLIAGATGSGKTVCMNSILAGLLMSRTPDQMRLMLVDPKIVEFSVYNNLPHLVVPVVTDPKKVSLGLRWAINEMEQRYKLFAKAGVRNIEAFNNREIATQGDLFSEEEAPDASKRLPDSVPYIVIVIDELADLMLADQAEIENCIARLAQLSRAVGIHMILSTQRPSVNVITGTIKANFPARVAFQVAQKTDSRTILDSIGAEKLLGRGDMLFLPPSTSKLVRAQGALTADDEIARVTDFIRQQGTPEFEVEIKEKLDKKGGAPSASDSHEDDELLEQAVEIIRETHRASTSSLQRRLRIGYNRAGRLMDVLEERGIIGPPQGSGPREILIDLDGEIPDNAEQTEADAQDEES